MNVKIVNCGGGRFEILSDGRVYGRWSAEYLHALKMAIEEAFPQLNLAPVEYHFKKVTTKKGHGNGYKSKLYGTHKKDWSEIKNNPSKE